MTISLKGKSKITWVRPDGCPAGFEPSEVVVGNSDAGGMALEIAITKWTKNEPPTREALTRLHTLRTNKRATPVVLVVEFDSGGTLVFGPNTASAPAGPLPVEQTQRVVQAALDEPNYSLRVCNFRPLAGGVHSFFETTLMSVRNPHLGCINALHFRKVDLNGGYFCVGRRRTQVDDQALLVEVHPIAISGNGCDYRLCVLVLQHLQYHFRSAV